MAAYSVTLAVPVHPAQKMQTNVTVESVLFLFRDSNFKVLPNIFSLIYSSVEIRGSVLLLVATSFYCYHILQTRK